MREVAGSDESLVMLSALQHWLFCRRQCALIHLEQAWAENRLTASGRVLHERVDERKSETRRTLRQATAVRLVSRRLGVWGVADMVEFHRAEAECAPDGTRVAAPIPGLAGFWKLAWQKKKQETILHPFLGEKVEIGLLPYVQALLLARHLRGDLDAYPPFLLK